MDTLGIEPRASRMLSGCDTTTPCAHMSSSAQLRYYGYSHAREAQGALTRNGPKRAKRPAGIEPTPSRFVSGCYTHKAKPKMKYQRACSTSTRRRALAWAADRVWMVVGGGSQTGPRKADRDPWRESRDSTMSASFAVCAVADV